MIGMSNKNGGYLNDIKHLKQSIIDILTTPIGSRVICRDYGSNLFQLIDMPINRELFSRIYATVADAIDKWEPRFKVEKIKINAINYIVAHRNLLDYSAQNFIGEFSCMNLPDLATPQIFEELSLSEILEQMRDKLISIEPEFSAYLESDPLIKLMEVAAYRELLLLQRINQAAKANLMAFATESDLDHLAAFYGITRKEDETDDELRIRTQAKIVGWSTAGNREAYKFHALNADSTKDEKR